MIADLAGMNLYPARDAFLQLARPGLRVPVVLELPLESRTPVQLFASLRDGEYGCILESGKVGRYSYVIPGAERIWESRGEECRIIGEESHHGNPFTLLREVFSQESILPNDRLRSFGGGAVGFITYDMARHIETLPSIALDDLDLPESLFLFVDRFYEFDPVDDLLRIAYLPRLTDEVADVQYNRIAAEIARMESAARQGPRESRSLEVDTNRQLGDGATLTQDEFERIVRRARDYIFAGDIFQVNLSIRYHRHFDLDPFLLYQSLREINPSPFMSYFDCGDFAIVSASPELLLRVGNGVIETRPIAGTRPRGATRQEDLANAQELIENEKERAEHLMLVDLERNDIGRVARYGSVVVEEFMGVEEYSHVIHIVSHVRGDLATGQDMFDAVVACFPGGTITGAPKVRAMEIIEELEPVRRGLYTGSIGWLGYDGSAVLNIVIRTILVKDGIAYVQAGAGIVADSVPENEYRESARKAEAALAAIEQTRRLWHPMPDSGE